MRDGLIFAAMIAVTLVGTAPAADAQTKTPNIGASAVLRVWSAIGGWQTVLARRDDQRLACGMFSGRADAGKLLYTVGIRQLPDDLSLTVTDADWSALSGDQIALIVDDVQVGSYPIVKHVNDKGMYRSVVAMVPKPEWQRIISLFQNGESVRFVTRAATFSFSLNGAAGSLINLQKCMAQLSNLQPR